jgi:hypothetical protein
VTAEIGKSFSLFWESGIIVVWSAASELKFIIKIQYIHTHTHIHIEVRVRAGQE